jgi:peptidoglycan/LPS O-acetylase OafA/YrhL
MWNDIELFLPVVFTTLFFIGSGMFFWDAGGSRALRCLFERHKLLWFLLIGAVCFGALTVITFVIYGEIPFELVPNLVLATFGCVGLLTMLVANSASAPESARAEIRLASRRGRKE